MQYFFTSSIHAVFRLSPRRDTISSSIVRSLSCCLLYPSCWATYRLLNSDRYSELKDIFSSRADRRLFSFMKTDSLCVEAVPGKEFGTEIIAMVWWVDGYAC